MKIKLFILAAVLFLASCSENPVSSPNIETDNEGVSTISGSGYTIIEGTLFKGVKPDTIHFEPNQYKMHMYIMETGPLPGEWQHYPSSIRINYDAGTIILMETGADCRYRILLFQ